MLVLSRKAGEKVRIGDDIVIEVVETRAPGIVRLGITAPRDIAVHRQEVYEAIQRDKGEAGK